MRTPLPIFVAGLFACLAMGMSHAEMLAPVETLGGYPVYGAKMPRGGLVLSVDEALARADTIVGSEHKFSGAVHRICDENTCALILAANETLVRVTFADAAARLPSAESDEALVFGELVRNASAGFHIVARSVLIK